MAVAGMSALDNCRCCSVSHHPADKTENPSLMPILQRYSRTHQAGQRRLTCLTPTGGGLGLNRRSIQTKTRKTLCLVRISGHTYMAFSVPPTPATVTDHRATEDPYQELAHRSGEVPCLALECSMAWPAWLDSPKHAPLRQDIRPGRRGIGIRHDGTDVAVARSLTEISSTVWSGTNYINGNSVCSGRLPAEHPPSPP